MNIGLCLFEEVAEKEDPTVLLQHKGNFYKVAAIEDPGEIIMEIKDKEKY